MPNRLLCAQNILCGDSLFRVDFQAHIFDWFSFACERTQDFCILTCLITAIVMPVLGLKATAVQLSVCFSKEF